MSNNAIDLTVDVELLDEVCANCNESSDQIVKFLLGQTPVIGFKVCLDCLSDIIEPLNNNAQVTIQVEMADVN